MKLNAIAPLLTVPDGAAAVEFYRGRLGFTCLNQMDAWACVGKEISGQ
jgi:catechol 2,3-dioxygenase-like lactoylglutathione lyase family enzyme